MKGFCTGDYGTSKRLTAIQAAVSKSLQTQKPTKLIRRPIHSSVIRHPEKISLPHGLSPDEIRLASEAGHMIEALGLPLFYAVLADQYGAERERRALVRELKSDIVQAQRESGVPPFWLEMQEGRPAWHSNLLFPLGAGAGRLVTRICRSKLYPGDLLDIQPANGSDWFVGYCSEERAPQARYLGGITMHRRLSGSHPNGGGGGDRVRVSKALEAELIAAGVDRWKKTYASRTLPAPSSAMPSWPIIEAPAPAVVDANGQLFLFSPKEAPTMAGSSASSSGNNRERPKLPIPTLPLDFPPTVPELLPILGPTHGKIAERIGLSRQQVTNIIQGRFGISRPVARRVLELARVAA